jgi:hypothetical protein
MSNQIHSELIFHQIHSEYLRKIQEKLADRLSLKGSRQKFQNWLCLFCLIKNFNEGYSIQRMCFACVNDQ